MIDYLKPGFTVDSVVLAGVGAEMKVLLIRRAKAPFQGEYALPGGFVDPHEIPVYAALRELEEETGIKVPLCRTAELSIRGKRDRDPRGWNISQPFLFWIPDTMPVEAGDDASHACWVHLGELEGLAFDHGAILCEALGCFWESMPTHKPVFSGLRAFGAPEKMPVSVTFYGGSFNPWHDGHSACLELCPDRPGLIVVPDTNPFKEQPGAGCFWTRYREICEKTSSHPGHVFPGFCGQEAPNPTFRWFPHARFPKKGLLLGDDSFTAFGKWTEAVSLLKEMNHVYVVPRNANEQAIENASRWFELNNASCNISVLGEHDHQHLSSSEIRAQNGERLF